MHIDYHQAHLTYCSNIHPGESWEKTFANLRDYTSKIKDELKQKSFGIGLRLSHEASIELAKPHHLEEFKLWLDRSNMYVFTINGFPYGGFHHQVVKDQVHFPDWSTPERLEYTLRLFDILKVLLPPGLDGGVSTSPISYRFWHKAPAGIEALEKVACQSMIQVALHLHAIKKATGQSLHLDIEPEPDGVMETSTEFVDFYQNYLLREGKQFLREKLDINDAEADSIIKEHIQLCYDVCHFAVGFEEPEEALEKIEKAGIKIGRIQISAALSSGFVHGNENQSQVIEELRQFDEPVYLHQAVIRDSDGILSRYPDLFPALEAWKDKDQPSELRTHFHVPIFTEKYGRLVPTQKDIAKVLRIWKTKNFTNHLEVETYTWDVLPEEMRKDIVKSVTRELQWVLDTLAE